MQRICVDMDEVMADTLAEHLRRYNQTFDEDVTPEDLAGKGLWEITPLDRQQQHAGHDRPQLAGAEVPLASAPLPLHPADALCLLRKQVHSPRRLSY
jgi:hypothetical protein